VFLNLFVEMADQPAQDLATLVMTKSSCVDPAVPGEALERKSSGRKSGSIPAPGIKYEQKIYNKNVSPYSKVVKCALLRKKIFPWRKLLC
jgi:hypothetical protein